MSVLAWIEQSNGQPLAGSWEVLGKARDLAGALGTETAALVMGAETSASVAGAQQYGADRIITINSPLLENYRLSAYAAALQQAISAAEATVVLMAATTRGRELSATVACTLNAGLAPDVVDLRIAEGKLAAVRTLYSGNILADVVITTPLQIASVRPRSFPLPAGGDGGGVVEELPLTVAADQIREEVVAFQASAGGEVNLADAKIIVSGGRGVAVDPAKGFALVAELAGVLGAAVGASRAAVDAGYIPYKHQVGQTGRTVRPDLYIAAGISGAIQHLAGMGGSKVIVAINKDREAPIFERAHYGLVGDLFEVLPALTAEFRRRL
jgi:electron transfer flavoprotein alpha subunit